jgi:ketosteroid isomerase-like protein
MPLPRWSRKPKSGPPHLNTIRALVAAFDAFDANEYVRHMTADVVVRPPGFMLGRRELHGRDEVKAAFAEFEGVLSPGRKIEVSNRRYFVDRADESKVLVVSEMTISRESGGAFGTEAALVATLTADSKVSRLESWPSEAEGLAQLEDPVAIDA